MKKQDNPRKETGFLAFKLDCSAVCGSGQRRICPDAGLSPQSTEFTKKKEAKKKQKGYCYYLLRRGHFYFAQKRTFLLCVDKNFLELRAVQINITIQLLQKIDWIVEDDSLLAFE